MPNKIALVTGAGSGVGRAVALAMIANGYDVWLFGRRAGELEATRDRAGSGAGRAHVQAGDVTDPATIATLFEAIRERSGRIDVLFNNAGTNAPPVPVEDLTLAQWNDVISVNLTGAFLVAQAAFRLMKAQAPQGGRIINNGSVSAHAPRPRSAPYTATKHAITGLTRSLSLDGRSFSIACGQIDIGNALTEMAAKASHGTLQADGTLRTEPLIDTRHVADAVVYMAGLPLEANVQFMTVMATAMPFIGRG